MAEEKIDELLNKQSGAPVVEKKQRTPVTILFSDIKGSTAYFEKRGDLEGLAMVQRHNDLLFPCVEAGGGRIVKTIGDAIMALFENPIGAVNAAVEMQRVLEKDCRGRPVNDQIHIRIGEPGCATSLSFSSSVSPHPGLCGSVNRPHVFSGRFKSLWKSARLLPDSLSVATFHRPLICPFLPTDFAEDPKK